MLCREDLFTSPVSFLTLFFCLSVDMGLGLFSRVGLLESAEVARALILSQDDRAGVFGCFGLFPLRAWFRYLSGSKWSQGVITAPQEW